MHGGKLKLVSFDVWDTLLSVRAFYRDIALELSKLLMERPRVLEDKLMEGYGKVRAIRRAGGFSDSEIVPAALKIMADFLGAKPETIERAVLNVALKGMPRRYLWEGGTARWNPSAA